MEYYLRFAKKYPRVQDLASADEDEVLKDWQGLGYYSRARNLLHAARQVMNDLNGRFPDSFASLRSLKGVGEYTAAAIASIAFNEAVPVVDGNVKRVISRLAGIKGSGEPLYKEVHKIMTTLIDRDHPGDFNQAVMEFGALMCVPKNPKCEECIFKEQCFAYTSDMVRSLPERAKKPEIRNRYFSYLVIRDEQKEGIALKKRSGNDIWKNLYEFPLIETDHELDTEMLTKHPDFTKLCGQGASVTESSETYKHKLSHRTILARFYCVNASISRHKNWKQVSVKDLQDYPVSRLIETYITDSKIEY
jgi:A/G-specific adenine glycosylase